MTKPKIPCGFATGDGVRQKPLCEAIVLEARELQRGGANHEVELGYFSLAEISAVRGPMRLQVERDLFFTPKPLSEMRARHERAR